MVIGYLTSLYARAADTFIRNEVIELRRRGHVVHTFSIRGPERSEAVSDTIRAEQASTDYILMKGAVRLLPAFAVSWLRQPRHMLSAAHLAWETCSPGLRAAIWQLAYLVEAAYLAREIQRKGIEHLHDHIGENSATVAMLAARIAGIPYSMTLHGPGEFFAPVRLALRQKIENAAFTACVSSFGRSQCMMWTPPEVWPRIHVVRCGLDPTFFSASPEPIPPDPRLVCIGRLSVQKGQILLLEALARLRKEGLRCTVTFIGDGPLRSSLEAFVRQHSLENSARFVGWMSSDEVRTEILRSRALVMPSFAEGLPVAILEAFALGRPVVATYVGGIPELVVPGRSGWLVPAGSVDEFARAMRDVVARPQEELAAMARVGRQRITAEHDLSLEVGRLLSLITGEMK
jgi:glycosyltransferase involved in cell wall biosynthesis